MISAETEALDIRVQGRIQGVGFRPFIYRLASDHNLYGWVNNQTSHVKIHIEGKKKNVNSFIHDIRAKAPPISIIDDLKTNTSTFEAFEDFSIINSVDSSDTVTEISPDLAVCDDCIKDIKSKSRRNWYSFTNCTNCGPRFSIIKDLPYDRPKTTMKDFRMCPECLKEYKSPINRRFHAQPNSCSHCGPVYTMTSSNEKLTDIKSILEKCTKIIMSGGIVAIKGVGGFHLACDPFNSKAVAKLRSVKKRDTKPFAVMFDSIKNIRNHAEVSEIEEKSLKSVRAPIVLLKLKKDSTISSDVTSGLNTIGCFLPYTPFHYLLMESLNISAMVLTSGNISNEPVEIDNVSALQKFSELCDAVLTYNRDIQNRTDDSVVRIINGKERVLRRSRGWVPESITVNTDVEGILATGSELKTCFCIGKDNKAVLSQHIGDLKNFETLEFYRESMERYKTLYRFTPSLIAHDLHPDYLTTSYFKNNQINKTAIQHHHAHIASCMAENGIIDSVIGFSFDGTGLGDDGQIWGGEIFTCNLENYERHFHFSYLPLPGGDKAVMEPWRMAVSALYSAYGRDFLNMNLPFLKQIPSTEVKALLDVIDKKINSPLTSSVGRLFDAVSAMLGLCLYSSFDAEAAMRLESVLEKTPHNDEYYSFQIDEEISMDSTFMAISDNIISGDPSSLISIRFHNTIVEIICAAAEKLRNKIGINKAVLSGGVFMNGYLLEKAEIRLTEMGFETFTHSKVPSNDGGLALGQLIIAAQRRNQERNNICV